MRTGEFKRGKSSGVCEGGECEGVMCVSVRGRREGEEERGWEEIEVYHAVSVVLNCEEQLSKCL